MGECGKALVLSGGGMFGAYQAGVWKAIAGEFRPDMIAGASIGALNGWMIAGGISPDELIDRWLRLDVRYWTVEREVERIWKAWQPQLPIGVAALELPLLRQHVFRDGEIRPRHLMASCAVPLVFRPVRIGGRWFVDGGLRGALPLWAARQMGATRMAGIYLLSGMPWWYRLGRQPPRSDADRTVIVAPRDRLGGVKDMFVWSRERARRWIDLGLEDGAAMKHFHSTVF